MGIIRTLLRGNLGRIILALVFVALSFLYSRREQGLPFNIEWIWHDQPVYHTTSPVTHVGLPRSYFTKGQYRVTQTYKAGFAFLGCDSRACVFDLPGQERIFIYYFNILLNLIFWYVISWLLIFIFGKFKKRAHGAVRPS